MDGLAEASGIALEDRRVFIAGGTIERDDEGVYPTR